ncbi:MAG: pepsin/retropepsin-like aspartic protease family protein [Planctomycetota bacterium]|jgi:hypothetical protein
MLKKTVLLLLLLILITPNQIFADAGDLNFDGVFEAALDIPRIWFLLKRDPNGEPLKYEGVFYPNYAYLDTGASGILLSYVTSNYLEISIHSTAKYADVGITGIEFFDVSEPLYIATAPFEAPDPCNPDSYHHLSGPWRFQVSEYDTDANALDILGVPVMAGKTVILNADKLNNLELFSADIKESNDPAIPAVDFNVPLRFEKFITPDDPNNIPPLPVLAYNPLIDNITAEYDGNSVTGSWLVDTGASISLISGPQAAVLGLTEPNASPIIPTDFVVTITGVGEANDVDIPGFQIDNLIIPTLDGYNLVFSNARIGVYNISVVDYVNDEVIILDGVYGSNFLTTSVMLESNFPIDIALSPFHKVIIDMKNGLLGFDVNDIYPLPTCGDANHPRPSADITGDCKVNLRDLYFVSENWLRDNCNSGNAYCDGADISQNGEVDLTDFGLLAAQWRNSSFRSICGDSDNPWPSADFNRDCSVDLSDLKILTDEWLNDCDWLNWSCRQADINTDSTVDFSDFAGLTNSTQ